MQTVVGDQLEFEKYDDDLKIGVSEAPALASDAI
jgi:hypothetical protein